MFLKLPDATLFVSDFGRGPRTVVAHGGWVGSGELWHPTFEPLSRVCRTVTYDHRGTGATLSRAPSITFDALVDDYFAVLDRLGIETCIAAGESSGAAVVLAAALRQPRRFEGLVLVSALYDGTPSPAVAQLAAGCAAEFSATMDAFVDACLPEEDSAAERSWGRKIVKRSNAKDALELLACLRGVDFVPQLSALTMPVLLLHGTRDAIRPVSSSEALRARLPNATLAIAEGAGHVPTITRAGWVADKIHAAFDLAR